MPHISLCIISLHLLIFIFVGGCTSVTNNHNTIHQEMMGEDVSTQVLHGAAGWIKGAGCNAVRIGAKSIVSPGFRHCGKLTNRYFNQRNGTSNTRILRCVDNPNVDQQVCQTEATKDVVAEIAKSLPSTGEWMAETGCRANNCMGIWLQVTGKSLGDGVLPHYPHLFKFSLQRGDSGTGIYNIQNQLVGMRSAGSPVLQRTWIMSQVSTWK